MSVKETTEKLLSLPRKFNELSTVSIYDLLKETGYFENHNRISVHDIQDLLIQYPKYIEDWIQYSEDKRCSSGWYLSSNNGTDYLVGYLNKDGNSPTEYSDKVAACAVFIKHEVDEMMGNTVNRERNPPRVK